MWIRYYRVNKGKINTYVMRKDKMGKDYTR